MLETSCLKGTSVHITVSTGVTIHVPGNSIQFQLLLFDFNYFDLIMQNILTTRYTTYNPEPFIAMFENMKISMSHMVCLVWKFSRGGRRATFLPRNTKWHRNCKCLYSSIKFWIQISQYNNSLRAL